MNVAIDTGEIPAIGTQAHELAKMQMQQWFDWMDRILDIHRSNFVFRDPSRAELDEHKTALKWALRYGHLMQAVIADPDFNEPDLAARLRIRLEQLEDAYNTFHDSSLSDEQAEKILEHIFPE